MNQTSSQANWPAIKAFLGLSLAALLLAACSGSASPAPAATSASTTSAPASSAAAGSTASTAAGSSTAPGASTSATGATTATLACTSPASPTTAETEGPYFKAGSSQVTTLVQSGMAGTRISLTGYVVNASCQLLAGAKVDIWQADSTGVYDNSGYRLRGYVVTDAAGRFTIETIIPGQYPGRTEHIHVKVTPAGGATLTTQLYFPGQTSNSEDGIFSPDLLLTMTPAGDAYVGTFTFVLRV